MTKTATEEVLTVLEAGRRAAKLSYTALGKELGGTRAAAWKWCHGLRAPKRGKNGEEGPAERLERWSGGKIHLGNFNKPAATAKPRGRK